MKPPTVNFKNFQSADKDLVSNAAEDIDLALSNHGFVACSDLDFSTDLVGEIFEASSTFFMSHAKTEARSAYLSA